MPTKINRRRFGLAAAALSTAAAAPAAETTYTSALNGFENKVSLPAFDPVAYTMRRHAAAPRLAVSRRAHALDDADGFGFGYGRAQHGQ